MLVLTWVTEGDDGCDVGGDEAVAAAEGVVDHHGTADCQFNPCTSAGTKLTCP